MGTGRRGGGESTRGGERVDEVGMMIGSLGIAGSMMDVMEGGEGISLEEGV